MITLLILAAFARADDLDLHRQDHQLHAAASYALTVSGADILGSPVAAGLAAFALGLLKESQDQHWSPGDIKANALGCATGAVFSWAVRF